MDRPVQAVHQEGGAPYHGPFPQDWYECDVVTPEPRSRVNHLSVRRDKGPKGSALQAKVKPCGMVETSSVTMAWPLSHPKGHSVDA